MPDADDFDVEYFRNLLQGKSPKHAPPAEPAPPPAKKSASPGSRAAAPAKKARRRPAAGGASR